ncbi:hypothetical protein WG66_011825 [Moniliophthora roreri]|uniref:Uncharacterized protein n=1 Tax=Moniliophthora roreri TaxID=221103 RepID=A0A0W0F288_MONRR|nr:hypothetical protein WG66_011825 [Moniliophthora roreri]
MGAAQSLLTPEAAVTVAVIVGAVGIGYKQATSTSEAGSSGSNVEVIEKKVGGGKKKGKVAGTKEDSKEKEKQEHANTSISNVVPFPAVIPGQFGDAETSGLEASTSSVKATKKSKGKKKKGAIATTKEASEASPIESVVSPSAAASLAQIQNESPGQALDSQPSGKKSKSKKQKKKEQAQSTVTAFQKPSSPPTTTPTPTQSQELPAKPAPKSKAPASLYQSTVSVDTDGEWTRVEARPKKSKTPAAKADESAPEAGAGARTIDSLSTGDDVGPATTSVTTSTSNDDEEEPHKNDVGQRRSLAERLLPKPRKTGVDDMLETPDYPTLSRVMRIQPQPGEKPAKGFSWGDYEDVIEQGTSKSGGYDGGGETGEGEDDDEGWGVVKSRGRPRPVRASTSQTSQTAQKAPETLTKKQRQNKARREAEKAAKSEFNAQQERTLAQNRAKRIEEEYKQQNMSKKTVSGGMSASIDSRGKLIWD